MTTNSMAYNRTLFLEDNLPVLRGLDSESVDLIATDPPFNKGVPAFEGTTKAGVNVEFKDVWNWDDDVQGDWIEQIRKKQPKLFNVIHYANEVAGDDMGAFLCFMAVRVLEMHRVLKDTGSIYLHCDPTASHYIKAMMDTVFGRENFRNEIIWGYTGPGSPKMRQFNRKHDIIFWYSKGKEWTFNRDAVRVPYKDPNQRPRKAFDTGGAFDPDEIDALRKRGKILETWWTDIAIAVRSPKERTGYPTQKPLKLYKRIIEASSNPGDIVLDPFAGCATTCVAAEQLDRQWIGVDIRKEAGPVIFERLQNEVSESMAWNDIVRVLTDAPERTDDGEPAAPELVLESPKKNAPKIPLPELRKRLIADYGLVCQGCGWVPPWEDDSFLEADHMKPSKVGGEDKIDNRALLCPPCNGVKSFRWSLQELRGKRYEENRMTDAFLAWWETEGKWDGGFFDGRPG